MNIKTLVDRGLALRAEIKRLRTELDTIETALANAGLYSDQDPLKDPDREGRRFLARGSELVVPVIFTADKIAASFRHDSPMYHQVSAASIGQIRSFYTLTQTWETQFKDGKQFRAAADQALGKDAPAFVTACLSRDKHSIPKSDTKVAWDDAEPMTP